MEVLENISLKKYNTFGIDVTAAQFATFKNVIEVSELLEINKPQTSKSDQKSNRKK